MQNKKVEINNINFEDIKRFIIFEIYYQEMMSLDLDKNTTYILNELMDYHYHNVYGNEYNNKYSDIDDIKYQCIVTFNN